jgi:hypothetical protein
LKRRINPVEKWSRRFSEGVAEGGDGLSVSVITPRRASLNEIKFFQPHQPLLKPPLSPLPSVIKLYCYLGKKYQIIFKKKNKKKTRIIQRKNYGPSYFRTNRFFN